MVGHPFHLHGYVFRVLAMGQFVQNSTLADVRNLNERRQINKNFEGPLKDTVSVPTPGFVVIRFRANNPGRYIDLMNWKTL
jgi:FtsP/CotA-like multicopper oxidase with cupredoxin domain